MTTLEISLPEKLKAFAEDQATKAGFNGVSEYLQALLEEESQRWSDPQIEAELIKGLESGPPIEVDDEFWDSFRKRYRARLARRATS